MASDIQPDMTAIPSGTPGAQGSTGATGSAGATGAAGGNAYTTLSSPFTMPSVNASVQVAVASTAWMVANLNVYVATAGYMYVVNVDSSTLATLHNVGAAGNAAPTTVISSGGRVVSAGAVGETGADGASGGAGTDATAIHDNVAGELDAITAKSAPTISDVLLLEDAAASFAKKKTLIGLLPIQTTVQSALDLKQNWDAALDAISAMTAGIPAITGAGAASARTITGSETINVTDGNGVSGNPTLRTYQPVLLGGDSNVNLDLTGDRGVFAVSAFHVDFVVTEMILWDFSATPAAGLTLTLRDTSGAGGNSLLGTVTGLNTIATTALGCRVVNTPASITAVRHVNQAAKPSLYLNVSVANGTALTCSVAIFGYYLPTYAS